jgi:FimV-like protein
VAAASPTSPAAEVPDGGEIKVKPGDSLSRIASRTQRPGISLDQMLVALYRGNPQAFAGENMNRLKAGSVLAVPGADSVRKITPSEARDVIQAQSSDFAAYRQRLASGVTTTADAGPARQATGNVTAKVDDRKQTGNQAPDKLTLSQGAVKASAPEAKVSKEAERKDTSTRVAELSRNLDELNKADACFVSALLENSDGSAGCRRARRAAGWFLGVYRCPQQHAQGRRRDLVPRKPPAARFLLRRQRRPARRHPRGRPPAAAARPWSIRPASSMPPATSTRWPKPMSTWPMAATCRPRRSSRKHCAHTRPDGDSSKLLEVYAKRRDTKGFELLATQMLTR